MKNSDRLTYRPLVGGEEVQKTTTVWRAEAITKMVKLTAISLDMSQEQAKKVELCWSGCHMFWNFSSFPLTGRATEDGL